MVLTSSNIIISSGTVSKADTKSILIFALIDLMKIIGILISSIAEADRTRKMKTKNVIVYGGTVVAVL